MSLAAAFLLMTAGLSGCGNKPPEGGRLRVFVSILPQAFIVDQIAGGAVDVSVLVGPGQSPAFFEPSPQQMAELERADIYLRIGVPFESQLVDKIARLWPELGVVDTRRGIDLVEADHHHGGGHDHGNEPDPHIWMDPGLVKIQAATVGEALIRLDSARADMYRSNLAAFTARLDSLDRELAGMLAPYRGERLYVFHPAFGYFARAYGLVQVPIEIEGKEPGSRRLAEFIERARAERVKIIFVQKQFSTRSAETIARAIGGTVVTIDPLAYDYSINLRTMAEDLLRALSPKNDGGEND